MRQLARNKLTGSRVATHNSVVIPPWMDKTLVAALTGVATDLETPADYLTQVAKAREIWPAYGAQTGKYPDPIVSAVMDMYVYAAVSFGYEILLKDAPVDSDAKKVLDHWYLTVNKDDPMLTTGMDAVRKQLHRGRWCDGGVVIGWDAPTGLKTFDGIAYKAPAKVLVYPRTMFEVKAGNEFGDMELILKTDISDFTDLPSEEIDLDEKRKLQQGMLEQKRYQVVDRNRQESAQKYPVPFLIERGLHAIASRIRAMQRGDYETVSRILRAVLLITQGSDKWLEQEIWQPADAVPDLAAIVSQVTTADKGYAQVVGAPDSTEMTWVTPDLEGLLADGKFTHDDYERMSALGVMEIVNTGQRRSFVLNPKPMIMEIWDAMRADKRFMEDTLFSRMVEWNPGMFSSLPIFSQKPVSIFFSPEQFKLLEKMYEWGLTTFAQTLEHGFRGADMEATIEGHKYEKASGFDKIIQPRTTFQQSVEDNRNNGDDDEETEDDEG